MNLPFLRFLSRATGLFACCYSFNILFIGLVSPGGIYVAWLARYVNYIGLWRSFLLWAASAVLSLSGEQVSVQGNTLYLAGSAAIRLSYSCIGYGVFSFLTAFAIAWPGCFRKRSAIIVTAGLALQAMNILRLVLIARFGKYAGNLDLHLLYDMTVYFLLLVVLCKLTGKPGEDVSLPVDQSP